MGNNNFQNFKYEKLKRNAALAGGAIMICITLLSRVSSFLIYRQGFGDMPAVFQNALGLFAVYVVEGTFCYLIYGLSKAFSSGIEKGLAVVGLFFVVITMLTNLVTHFQMAKGISLHPYQTEWINWGAVVVFIAVLLIIIGITLGDPIAQLVRLDLRVWGRQQETILQAQQAALESDRIQSAMQNRADSDAEKLARQIEGNAGGAVVLDDGIETYFPSNGHPAFAQRYDDESDADRRKTRKK
jgi:hypothetical protein